MALESSGQEAELDTLLGPSVGVGESMESPRDFGGRVSPLGVWDSREGGYKGDTN